MLMVSHPVNSLNDWISVGGKLQVRQMVFRKSFPGNEQMVDSANRRRAPVLNARTASAE